MNRPSYEPGQCREVTQGELGVLLSLINRVGLKQLKAERAESPEERGRLKMEAEAIAEYVRSFFTDARADFSQHFPVGASSEEPETPSQER